MASLHRLARMMAMLTTALARVRRLERHCHEKQCECLKNLELQLERLKIRLETYAFLGAKIPSMLRDVKETLIDARNLLREVDDPMVASILIELGNEAERLLTELSL